MYLGEFCCSPFYFSGTIKIDEHVNIKVDKDGDGSINFETEPADAVISNNIMLESDNVQQLPNHYIVDESKCLFFFGLEEKHNGEYRLVWNGVCMASFQLTISKKGKK